MIKNGPFEVTVTGMHSIHIPETSITPFINAGHKRVVATLFFAGKSLTFHAAIHKNKDGLYSIMFSKNKQKELGIFPNDYFELQLQEDTSKYGVEMPEELEAVFYYDSMAFAIFENFTAGKKRSIICSIAKYKNVQTRVDKSILLCENLKKGIRHGKDLLKVF